MLGRNEGTQPMRAMTIRQPWASLVVLGVKRVETRSWRAPAALIGQRIAIHASAKVPPLVTFVGDYHVAQGSTWLHGPGVDVRMAFGAVVGSAVLTACIPMTNRNSGEPDPGDGPYVTVYGDGVLGLVTPPAPIADFSITDQRPYGDFAPGRWAWIFTDAAPTTERCPCDGCRKGVVEADNPTSMDLGGHLSYNAVCPVCDGVGRCAPIENVKGRLGLWRWEP